MKLVLQYKNKDWKVFLEAFIHDRNLKKNQIKSQVCIYYYWVTACYFYEVSNVKI